MELQNLIRALRAGAPDNHRCLGCGYEHDCSIHGCRVMRLAADALERLLKATDDPDSMSRAEKQAVFRLGQMDMQQSILSMIRDTANNTKGLAESTLLSMAEMIAAIEVQP